MIKFKRMIHLFFVECSILLILWTIHIKAVDQRIGCQFTGSNVNDVHYESDEKSRIHNCGKSSAEKDLNIRKSIRLSSESDESSEENAFEIDTTNIIQPTSTDNLDYYSVEASDSSATESLSEFLRNPRSMIDTSGSTQADDSTTTSTSIEPTSTIEQSTQSHTDTPRDRGQNADIQDIITGIVKLLNGNVNVQTNAQIPQFPQTTRRYASRINNRGPPRITDLPAFPNLDIQKTTTFPSGIRRPAIPYPFDLPENPIRSQFPQGVPLNEHPHQAQNNKPQQVQQNRPPWHGSRTRPPINGNPNRLQLPARPTINPPPVQPTQDYRPPAAPPGTRAPEKSKIPDNFNNKTSAESQEEIVNKRIQPTLQLEPPYKEPSYKEPTYKEPTTYKEPATYKEPTYKDPPHKEPPHKEPAYKEPPSHWEPPHKELIHKESLHKDPPRKAEHPEKVNKVVPPPNNESSTMPTKSMVHIESSKSMEQPKATATPTTSSTQILKTTSKVDYHESSITPQLPQVTTPKIAASSSFELFKTNETDDLHIKSTIAPTKVSKPSQNIESTEFPTFYSRRPGIVLDDTLDYKPAAHLHTPIISSSFNSIHPNEVLQSSSTLSNIYAEIFDVTLSAIQGPGHSKVVDFVELSNQEPQEILQTKLYGAEANDIIVSPSEGNSVVSIDGKRTYINLFGETVESEHVRKPVAGTKSPGDHGIIHQSAKPTITFVDNPKTANAPNNKGKPPHFANKVIGNYTGNQAPLSMRYNYRTKPQQNAIRIDTCIVGDDTTCDTAQNEMCKTDVGVSSCHCRPGYSRRKYRDPCRKVLSLLISMRVDRYYDKRIVWDKVFAENTSEQYEHLSYEAILAIDSVISMTPFSDDFISARVNNIYPGNPNQGSGGVFVNLTIQLDGSTVIRNYVQSDLQKQLVAVVHRRNNNIGNSALYVDSPTGSVSALEDLDECSSPDLNDCHASANCTNSWGTFQCKCAPGLRDPWSDQIQRAGRECISCSNSYCNNRGTCQYDALGTQLVCECMNNYYGAQCEIDGDILAVSVGASVIAVLIITLTLICLIMWGRRWNQEQKEIIGSPIFNYINRANLENHMKTMQSKTYQAALEDRMRWAQIADVMSQSNHYAVEPVASQRVGPAPMYMYQNMPHPNNTNLPASLSMAGTLPIRSLPVSRMEMESASKMGRRHENTSSSEEDDLVDLLGSNYQSQTGIYYDVDCESSDQQHGGTSTLQSTLDTGCSGPYGFPNPQRMSMSTYNPNHMYQRN